MKYRAFGLTIESDIELPELEEVQASAADIEISIGTVPGLPGEDIDGRGMVRAGDTSDTFAWDGVARFEVEESRIVVEPHPTVSQDELRQPLLGIVVSNLLRRRGFLVLHASVVSIDGHIVGFVGPKRAGKSTTAATLVRRGHELLSDDTLIVDTKRDPIVFPGFARLNLWPEAARALSFGEDETRELYSGVGKLGASVKSSFRGYSGVLESLYGLGFGELGIRSLRGHEAFSTLLPHTYEARYFPDRSATSSTVLPKLASLLNRVPLKMLTRRVDLTRLDEMAALIERDIENVTAGDSAAD